MEKFNEPLIQMILTDENDDILAQKSSLGFDSALEALGKLELWWKNRQGELEAEAEQLSDSKEEK